MKDLYETLMELSPMPGNSLYAIPLEEATPEAVSAAAEAAGRAGAAVAGVTPTHLLVEAAEAPPGGGDASGAYADGDDAHGEGPVPGEEGSGDGGADDVGEGFEISAEDWSSVLLVCEGRASDVDPVAIEWLVKTGLVEPSPGGHPRPTQLARKWVENTKRKHP